MGVSRGPDAIVVGAGPNGLAAALALARAGRRPLVLEAHHSVGGGSRSAELTLPGFIHDVCAAIYGLAACSPFLRRLPLARYGLEWVHSPLEMAHPFDDGSAAVLRRSVAETAAGLGADGHAYRALFGPLVANAGNLMVEVLAPLHLPCHPLLLARFGLPALVPARFLAERLFRGEHARAILAGMAAHSAMPLEWPLTSAIGLVTAISAHAVGWLAVRGGSQRFAEALAGYLRSLGGVVETGAPVASLSDLPPARAVLCDLTPRPLLRLAGDRLPAGYRRKLSGYRYGVGVCKVDYALAGPVPWRAPECRQTITIHVGGALAEIAASERAVWQGEHPERPFVLVCQQSLFDPSRTPAGKQTLWAYCHVPGGSNRDVSDRIEAQIERFAPGFRDLILARSVRTAAQMQSEHPNYVGGDINGGVQDWRQLYTRPVASFTPYATPAEGLYICSSATPPGGGVHGMCGYHAARAALQRQFKR